MHNEPYISIARGFVKLIFAVQQFKWEGLAPTPRGARRPEPILRSGAAGVRGKGCDGAAPRCIKKPSVASIRLASRTSDDSDEDRHVEILLNGSAGIPPRGLWWVDQALLLWRDRRSA